LALSVCGVGATVCKTVRPMLSVRCLSVCLSVSLSCLSVLSVTFVHCGQTVVRIKMKLGMPVGLGRVGPGHIVLGGHSPPIFGPYLLRSNGCMDQDVTWYGARPRPRRLCVRRGPISPPPRKEHRNSLFSARVYCAHGRPSQLLLSSLFAQLICVSPVGAVDWITVNNNSAVMSICIIIQRELRSC